MFFYCVAEENGKQLPAANVNCLCCVFYCAIYYIQHFSLSSTIYNQWLSIRLYFDFDSFLSFTLDYADSLLLQLKLKLKTINE